MLDSECPLERANIILVAAPIGDYQMPSKSEIKDRQDAVARGLLEVATPLGTVTRGKDGVYRDSYQAREGFNDWGGRGYDDFVPGEVTKTAPSGNRTT